MVTVKNLLHAETFRDVKASVFVLCVHELDRKQKSCLKLK